MSEIENDKQNNKQNCEFKPYHLNFGKYKNLSYIDFITKDKDKCQYINFLKKLDNKSNGVKHFLNWYEDHRLMKIPE